MLADEQGKPISTFQEQIDALEMEERLIGTVDDLILVVENEKLWQEISSTWPKEIRTRIETKLKKMGKGRSTTKYKCFIF